VQTQLSAASRLFQLVPGRNHRGLAGNYRYEGQAFGIGSAFLLAGVPNYIGTFWVVHDEESVLFARTFYQSLAAGDTMRLPIQPTISRSLRALIPRSITSAILLVVLGLMGLVVESGEKF